MQDAYVEFKENSVWAMVVAGVCSVPGSCSATCRFDFVLVKHGELQHSRLHRHKATDGRLCAVRDVP